MKLWILRARNYELPRKRDGSNPWEPWYDKAFAFVVRAETEQHARDIADANGGDENRDGVGPWLDAKYSTCEPLTDEGAPGLVCQDFHAA